MFELHLFDLQQCPSENQRWSDVFRSFNIGRFSPYLTDVVEWKNITLYKKKLFVWRGRPHGCLNLDMHISVKHLLTRLLGPNKDKLTGAGFEVVSSNPALLNFSLFSPKLFAIYPVSFPCGLFKLLKYLVHLQWLYTAFRY